jgi:hypothetical protein
MEHYLREIEGKQAHDAISLEKTIKHSSSRCEYVDRYVDDRGRKALIRTRCGSLS